MKKRIKTAKDIKIDEIIKLVGQVNANNKKFNDSNDKYAKNQRKKTLDTYFKEFQRSIIRDKNTTNIANDFHTKLITTDKNGKKIVTDKLNITKSKVFYRQISDENLDKLLDSLRDLQYGKKVGANTKYKNAYEVTINGKKETRLRNTEKTFAGWKKKQDDFKKGFIENTIKDFKKAYSDTYEELRKQGLSDEDIANSIKSLIEQGNYSNSDQLIEEVAKEYDVYDKLMERAFDLSNYI